MFVFGASAEIISPSFKLFCKQNVSAAAAAGPVPPAAALSALFLLLGST